VISVEVRVRVRLRIRLRDRDWVISDATNNTTSRSRDQFSSTRGTSPDSTISNNGDAGMVASQTAEESGQ
jgi:hypothetical protein